MAGYDWNGSGSHDAFDSFMDMEVMSDSDSDSWDSDFDSEDAETEDFDYTPIGAGLSSARPQQETKDDARSFQQQLRDNLRSLEAVKREEEERLKQSMNWEAEGTLREIKQALMYNVKNAKYTSQNGRTTVSCFCDISQRFMRTRESDNMDQLKKDQQTFFLFRDPNLQHQSWISYEIDPAYKQEYYRFIEALRILAGKENIKIESVVYNSRDDKYVSFPSKMVNDYYCFWYLSVRATTTIPSDTKTAAPAKPQAYSTTPHSQNSTSTNKTTQNPVKEKQTSNEINPTKNLISSVFIMICGLAMLFMEMPLLGIFFLLIGVLMLMGAYW